MVNAMSSENGVASGPQSPEQRNSASSFSRYTKGLLVKLNEPVRPLNGLDNLLNPVLMSNSNGATRRTDYMLSATDRMADPVAWHKQLTKAAAQPRENGKAALANGNEAEHPLANGRSNSGSSADTEEAGPAKDEAIGDAERPDVEFRPSLGAPLGEAGRLQGREIIAALRHARHVLQASLQNLAGARDEAVFAQRAFYPLMRLLEDAEKLMRGCKERTAALEVGQTWAGNAHTVVHELDTNASGLLMDSGAGTCLAPDWATYAQNAALRLRDLEDELWQGHVLGLPVKIHPPEGPEMPARMLTSRRPTLSYQQHWRNKTAL